MDQIEGSDTTLRWTSPGDAYVSGAGVPPSRGRPCAFSYQGRPAPTVPCGSTDGVFVTQPGAPVVCTPTSSTNKVCDASDALTIDMGAVMPISAIVVRGCDACELTVGATESSLTAFGTPHSDVAAVIPAGGRARSGRYVQIAISGGAPREVSVWGPATKPALATITAKDSRDLMAPFGFSRTSKHRDVVIAIAAVLIALVLLGLSFALGRRRRT